MIWTICIGIPLISLSLIHFLSSRKYMNAALQFANAQTLLFLVGSLELSIILSPHSPEIDGFLVLISMMSSLSIVSYCQRHLAITYVLSYIYVVIRCWFWLNGDSTRYLKVIVFFLLSFCFIAYNSRIYNTFQREQFQ